MTKFESHRITRMLQLGCCACWLEELMDASWQKLTPEVHHLLDGGGRMGHVFTIPLCVGHHRNLWPSRDLKRPSIAGGSRKFNERYGEQRTLWIKVQRQLGLSEEWPDSKILARAL